MLMEKTKEGKEGMRPVIRSEPLLSKRTDVVLVSEADKRPLNKVVIMQAEESKERKGRVPNFID